MKANEVRRTFLEYFVRAGHRELPSSPLVLPNDPTLLFANAGMNQFKDLFTGAERRDYSRATTSQKCLRVSGKHNDLEMVGRTPRHHTFFEMLGNFSFGDYFKEQAIELAWTLITDVYGISADRLWVSVFRGNDDVPADDEAFAFWRDKIGVPESRILRLGESENFWRMGDTGPCGPCSEIHYDLGAEFQTVKGDATPENDDRRFLEIWNLVFMQFEQRGPSDYAPLPSPSIDTGMGLERVTSVLQGCSSNYDSDVFSGLLAAAADRAGKRYGADEEHDFSMRVIADHARAFCFLVADGVVPANDKRGYVLRRLLRRAIRHGRKLGIQEPFLDQITPVVLEEMGGAYPELAASGDAILEIGRREEQRFGETLATGLTMLDQAFEKAGGKILPGKELFKLYDSFGFPLDLARDVAEERGLELDEAGFDVEMKKQRERAQASWKGAAAASAKGAWAADADCLSSEFVGYERLAVEETPLLALRHEGQSVERLQSGERGELVLGLTPFYAESGGQIGDRGSLVGPNGAAAVLDVQKVAGGLFVHQVEVRTGELKRDDLLRAEVDGERRLAIQRHHTATHLIHAALREVVGTHVKQAGSLVAEDRLRFDFSHFAPISDESLTDIEQMVNREVLKNSAVETSEQSIEDALASGAMALFGEKYGDLVRTVRIGDFSHELCGGTHTERSGEIGLLKLTGERGVASGTRRIEALAGEASLARFRGEHSLVRQLEDQLSVSADKVMEELDRRNDQLRALQRELEKSKIGGVRERLLEAAQEAPEVAGIRLMTARVDELSSQEMRELADQLRGALGSGVVVLGRAGEGKASLLVAVTKDRTSDIQAGALVRTLGRMIGGGGGGRPDLAEAGGKKPEALDAALAAAAEEVAKCLKDDD